MDEFQIETAQNVSINQQVANLSSRIMAYLIDVLIIISYFILINMILNALDFKKGLIIMYITSLYRFQPFFIACFLKPF